MGSIFKPKISLPPPPPIEVPDPVVEDTPPKVDDEETVEVETEEMRKRNRKRKGRRSTILTTPELEDEEPTLKKPLLPFEVLIIISFPPKFVLLYQKLIVKVLWFPALDGVLFR